MKASSVKIAGSLPVYSAFPFICTGGTASRGGETGVCSLSPSPQTQLPMLRQPHSELRKLEKLN